ncbi:hypothetical protein SASPL_156583 [Salvia splendens]|uniref:Cation/H+ exchanger domain-containing protein n=1 Tax=Salvia splendens TaxID=180675 RepID=A0A8X8YWK1_SALSN|nr:hypothetical protein SASPL_156583 [Salvia splendens]
MIVCYAPTMITTNGIWQGDNPLDYSLPLFILQLTLIVVTTRWYNPGPSVLGKKQKFADNDIPLRSVMVLETMANVGLLYFLFLIGVEMDITVIKRTEVRVCEARHVHTLPRVALSVTSFPVLARILAELKLLNSEIGRLAMSSALITTCARGFLLAFAIALAENEAAELTGGESVSEFYICLILTGVMISGFITDALGTHLVRIGQSPYAISPYSTMHEDICEVAEAKRVALIIILPQAPERLMVGWRPQPGLPHHQPERAGKCAMLNRILVDRASPVDQWLQPDRPSRGASVLWRPDDRRRWRTPPDVGAPRDKLNGATVHAGEGGDTAGRAQSGREVLTVDTDNDREKQMDAEFINQFRSRTSNDPSVIYTEKFVNNGEETVAAIRSIDVIHDLFIVGRGEGHTSPLTAGLTDWSECPELGRLGICLRRRISRDVFGAGGAAVCGGEVFGEAARGHRTVPGSSMIGRLIWGGGPRRGAYRP